ncbi:MAG TPA: hypothetical protein VF042_03505 [Gemmatimonadaceae bacterium]
MVDWNIVAATSAAVSAAFAGLQIYKSRIETRERTTFEHLREIAFLVQSIRHTPPSELCDKVQGAYSGTHAWDDDCRSYLALLDGLELLAMARRLRIVDHELVDEFLSPVVRRELVTLSAITTFRKVWGDDTIYQDLGTLLLKFEQEKREAKKR